MTDQKNNKIAIVTIPGIFNYGNRLQAYATQRAIVKLGFEPVTLETTDMALTDRIYSAILHAMGRPVTTQDLLTTERRAAFERFQRLIKTLRTPLRKIDAKDYACFVAGSDQIWNPNFIAYGHPETLPFASEGKRVALAASIGISHIRDADKDWLAYKKGSRGRHRSHLSDGG